jgi:hypothetical protein
LGLCNVVLVFAYCFFLHLSADQSPFPVNCKEHKELIFVRVGIAFPAPQGLMTKDKGGFAAALWIQFVMR